MTTERAPAPVWASFEDWEEEGASWFDFQSRREAAKATWNARQHEIDALKARVTELEALIQKRNRVDDLLNEWPFPAAQGD